MRKELYLDLETTGLDDKTDTITQLAYIYVVGGRVKKKADYKSNFYNNFVRDLDTMVDKFNKDDKLYLIGHNSPFDSNFIRQLFDKNKNKFYGSYFYTPCICTMQFAAHKFMRKNKRPENFKLGTLLKYFKIPYLESRLHDAAYDIEKTRALHKKLLSWK